jgi:hypothetical protein
MVTWDNPSLRLLGKAFLQSAIVFLLSQPSSTLSSARQENGKPSVPPDEIGQPRSRLVASFRAEPKTLNPLTSADVVSRQVIALLDGLMQQQSATLDYKKRKALFDQVQQLESTNLPIIPIVSPNVLVGARRDLGNFHPAILEPHTLWNSEVLFLAPGRNPPCP